jgi:hypothetical protein
MDDRFVGSRSPVPSRRRGRGTLKDTMLLRIVLKKSRDYPQRQAPTNLTTFTAHIGQDSQRLAFSCSSAHVAAGRILAQVPRVLGALQRAGVGRWVAGKFLVACTLAINHQSTNRLQDIFPVESRECSLGGGVSRVGSPHVLCKSAPSGPHDD